ncbi:MAG TPA: cupin domain-containing protein [Steroidobacteraceae bacterium]|nr:cupin domain-containing protein [Steroidobacteraceae bacterium]
MYENQEVRKAAVLRPAEMKTYDRGGGAGTTPLVGASIGATAFINGITAFEPGAAIPYHSHNCEESVLVLEGDGVLDIGGEEIALRALDTTWIPPQVSHRFRNASNTRPLRIFWTYARMDATRTMTATGATAFVAQEYQP